MRRVFIAGFFLVLGANAGFAANTDGEGAKRFEIPGGYVRIEPSSGSVVRFMAPDGTQRIEIEGGYAVVEPPTPRIGATSRTGRVISMRGSPAPRRVDRPVNAIAPGMRLTAELGTPAERSPTTYEPAETPYINPFGPRAAAPAMRVGRALGADGRVPDSDQTDVFTTYDPIYVSVHAPASAGAAARLSIFGEDGRAIWSIERVVAPGGEFLAFDLGPNTLPPGRYVALVSADGRTLADHVFEVTD